MKTLPIIFLLSVLSFQLFAQNESGTAARHFDGFYAGIHAGSQNVYGASFLENKFVLAQESRFVSELFAGYRKQLLSGRLVVGAGLDMGFIAGDLMHNDPSVPLHIDYENKLQWSYGLTLGVTVGPRKNFLLYGYLKETTRKFDVTITDAQFTFAQTDKEGVMRYGFGFETPVYKNLHARVSVGGLRADFDDLETNIGVEDKLDFMLGGLWQF